MKRHTRHGRDEQVLLDKRERNTVHTCNSAEKTKPLFLEDALWYNKILHTCTMMQFMHIEHVVSWILERCRCKWKCYIWPQGVCLAWYFITLLIKSDDSSFCHLSSVHYCAICTKKIKNAKKPPETNYFWIKQRFYNCNSRVCFETSFYPGK